MKTIKHFMMLLVLLIAFGSTKAQCVWGTQVYNQGGEGYFSAYVDSNAIQGAVYWWDFGDGDTAHDYYPRHTYTTNGTYVACFNFQSNNCSFVSICDTLYNVDVCDLNPNITYSQNGLDLTFGVSNAPAGSTFNWLFYTGNGTVNETSANPTVTFANYNVYSAHVTVTAPNSCVDTAFTYVYLTNPCNANFGYYISALHEVSFNAYMVDSLNPSAITYYWDFGSNIISSNTNPVFNYDSNGVYPVCLTVIGPGCSDSVCQNINVTNPPVPSYYVSGYISNGSSNACSATVYLISDSAGYLSLVDMTHTVDSFGNNCNGSFWFVAEQGTYYIKAKLDSDDVNYSDYLPTYYGNELNWADALALNVNTTQTNININLVAGVNPGGPGFVGGWVTQGAGLAIGGGVDESRAAGDPIAGAQVNLLTSNDVAVATTYTDANGRYTFSNLQMGTYKVYVEEINKVPYPMNVTLDQNNPSQDNVNVTVNSTTAVTGIEDVLAMHVAGVYPNPVSDKTVITVSVQQNTKATMVLTDVNGRVMLSRNLEFVTGANQINIDLNGKAAGVYNLSLANGAGKKAIRLIKVNQ